MPCLPREHPDQDVLSIQSAHHGDSQGQGFTHSSCTPFPRYEWRKKSLRDTPSDKEAENRSHKWPEIEQRSRGWVGPDIPHHPDALAVVVIDAPHGMLTERNLKAA